MSATRNATSQDCFNDLHRHKLTRKYSLWTQKTSGVMDGVTLFGTHKDGSASLTYVKRYLDQGERKFHEADEFLIYYIGRACGANVPKVKLATTSKYIYSFSRNIADKKDGSKATTFFLTMNQLKKKSCIYKLDYENHKITTDKESYDIDKKSILKIAFMNMIFSLLDSHDDNLGFVIDTKNKIAELALIDFVIDHRNFLKGRSRGGTTIAEVVANHHTNKCYLRKYNIDEMPDTLIVEAFNEFSTNFDTACKQAIELANGYHFLSRDKLSHAKEMLEQWRNNFNDYQSVISAEYCRSYPPRAHKTVLR